MQRGQRKLKKLINRSLGRRDSPWQKPATRVNKSKDLKALAIGLSLGVALIAAYELDLVSPSSLLPATNNIEVIDGDSLIVDGIEMRLQGIDAPEYDQPCLQRTFRSCGSMAETYLRDEIIADADVACTIHDTDQYGRSIASCYIGNRDIEQEMVRAGYATAYRYYSTKYVEDEDYARANNLGLWSYGWFEEPYQYRRRNR